jgi:hypothetical protein
MQLFIHFGLYKTGSSFLQTICANNRAILKKHAIFFPESVREEDMLAGRISPGNGNGIAIAIKAGKVGSVNQLIKKWKDDALKGGFEKILISDEALIHGFVFDRGLSCLMEASKMNGINDVFCLGFFRDPVDHCLSTFKHRAKKGSIQDFEKWVSLAYETPETLKAFLSIYKKYPIHWSFAKYQRNGIEMAKLFFEEWLHIEMPSIPKTEEVNPSLTLSEIGFLQMASQKDRSVVFQLYKNLIALPTLVKADNKQLDRYYRSIIAKWIHKYDAVFQSLNEQLMHGDKLELESNLSWVNDKGNNIFSFSPEQLDAITNAYNTSHTFSEKILFYMKNTFRNIKRGLRKLK